MAVGYKAYVIGPDDCIVSRFDLICDDDDAAKERARQLVDRHPIELWQAKGFWAGSSRCNKAADFRSQKPQSLMFGSRHIVSSSTRAWLSSVTESAARSRLI
jgi:hypothetical protein